MIFEVDMKVEIKKKIFGAKTRKVLFAICCIIFAFILWFVIKYNQLGELTPEILFG